MSNLSREAKQKLEIRGYKEHHLDEEEIHCITAGDYVYKGVPMHVEHDSILFVCRGMSGEITGVHTMGIAVKDYRLFQLKRHLPGVYMSQSDCDLMYKSGRVTLVEGAMDRIAVKVCYPHTAVIARLSKGVSNSLVRFLKRYCREVTLLFDMDTPGRTAVREAQRKLTAAEIFTIEIEYPAKDPSELLLREGNRGMREVLDSAIHVQTGWTDVVGG